jgi:hypothetical protein
VIRHASILPCPAGTPRWALRLGPEGWRRSLAGQPRAEIVAYLAAEAERAFDRLEPALGHYGIRP